MNDTMKDYEQAFESKAVEFGSISHFFRAKSERHLTRSNLWLYEGFKDFVSHCSSWLQIDFFARSRLRLTGRITSAAISLALSKLIVEFAPSVTTSLLPAVADYAIDLLDAIRQELLKQKEEKPVNFLPKVSDQRTSIAAVDPAPGVNITINICCLSPERLNGDNGTQVTVIDVNLRGLFEATFEGLMDTHVQQAQTVHCPTSSKRKQFIVWGAKGKVRPRRSGQNLSKCCHRRTSASLPARAKAKKKGKTKLREVDLSIELEDASELDEDSGNDMGPVADAMEDSADQIVTAAVLPRLSIRERQ
ncbi:hypothetical protein PF008_g6332 [Phytophthora fragariae]|uniref:Uncharacterized protein n=1 Tax=Phytophthora fragariae TaxID=53985 RepID=A0A6G0S6B8_9STRA|nr:hypothetical protein PF008_g6332 [Phytophthora fragariae]